MSAAVEELVEEFRRLAAEAYERSWTARPLEHVVRERQKGKGLAFEEAAQMLEEKLNG